jgi:hypothetical protein
VPARPSTSTSPASSANIDTALAWAAAHDPKMALRTVTGFGWAWVVLGDSRGAQRILTALKSAGGTTSPTDRADALLLAAWIEASTGHLDLARQHIAAATEVAEATGSAGLLARCSYYLAYVVSHDGEFRAATALTKRSGDIYDTIDRPWDRVANGLFAVRAAISAGDVLGSITAAEQFERWLRAVEDPWLQVRGEAMLGELVRLEHRFDDAVDHLGRAAETSRKRGFLQTAAYQVMSLGRGLAAMDAADRQPGSKARLQVLLRDAQAAEDAPVEVFALDALARIAADDGQLDDAQRLIRDADRRMLAASHFITPLDRSDARWARHAATG